VTNEPSLAEVYQEIREKAVECLQEKNDEELMSIMLQLVQAFRYEKFDKSSLKKFLFQRVFNSIEIANSFHWLIHLEKCNEKNPKEIGRQYQLLYSEFIDILSS
jgi:uncharacterized protein YecE (DUF72 family)